MDMIDRAEPPPKPCLLTRLSFVQCSAYPVKDDSSEEFVDDKQQAHGAIVANVVDVSLLVQQHGPAGFPLVGTLHSDK